MTTIADQSTMTPWPLWAWVIAMALVVAAQLILLDHRARATRPVKARTVQPRCWHHRCPYEGRVRLLSVHDGHTVTVCQGHAAECITRGYYRRAA